MVNISDAMGRPAFLLRHLAAALPLASNPQDRAFLHDLFILGGLLFGLATITCLGTVHWNLAYPRDATSLVIGRDFLNLWMMGRGAFDADPARLYDVATYNAELATFLGPGYPGQNLPNPPVAFITLAPFGLLPYFSALFAWTIVSWIALVGTARHEIDGRVIAVIAMSPAALMCVLSGQSSFLTTAVLVAIFALLDRRPLVAGCLIGLLVAKPQLGILFPIALIASRRWRVLAAAAATTIALLSLSVAVHGIEIWHGYVFKALPLQKEVLFDPSGAAAPFQTSVFMSARGMFGNATAQSLQLAFAVGAAGIVAWAFAKKRHCDPSLLRALFLACTASASPYMGSYDMLPLTFAAIALLASGALDQTGRRLAQLVFWTPALQLLFGMVQLPGPGLIPALFAVSIVGQLRSGTCRTDAANVDRAQTRRSLLRH